MASHSSSTSMEAPVETPSDNRTGHQSRRALLRGRRLGIGLAVLAAVFASSAGILVRQVDAADAWTLLLYRSLGFVAVVSLFIFYQHGRATAASFRRIGRPGIAVSLCLGFAFLAFVLALARANVAVVMIVLGASPMLAALIGVPVLGERPGRQTWLAIVIAFCGVALTVSTGLDAGSWAGLALALLACLGYSAAVVGLRAGRDRDMTPAVCLSGVVAGAIALPTALMLGDPGGAARDVVVVGLLLGAVQIGAQYILLTFAARHASAADLALTMILEVILAPFWVWLLLGETVPAIVMLGGAIVIAGIAVNAFARPRGMRRPRQ